ncbi:MAG: hypothetical protein PW786_07065 [Arachidicoccus sp.]|nr:hypothetical protein [Arachidicoccus sp.]
MNDIKTGMFNKQKDIACFCLILLLYKHDCNGVERVRDSKGATEWRVEIGNTFDDTRNAGVVRSATEHRSAAKPCIARPAPQYIL